jgi:RNA polymerase sigma-70 factor (ECF subfamily)
MTKLDYMKKQPEIDTLKMERLFKKHYELLCLVSYGIIKDRDAVKDIVQDFFISYCQRKESISHTVSFKVYAIRAVKNLSLLSLKKAKKEKSLLHDLNIRDSIEEKALDEANKGKKLQRLLDKLPESRRHIFMSFVVHGQSYSEIAENNGISINTVKTQMKRAYAFLRVEATKDLLYFFLFVFTVLL